MSKYANPVVRGFSADPSIVRVGHDYYLANSTMDHLPGVTIRHSTDLVHWRVIGAAVTRPSQYRRDGLAGEVVLYAPTLRYEDGTFYVACTNVAKGQGNFIVRTTDPAGDWSDALWLDTEGFDPSLLCDEGVWYYTRRTLEPRPDGRLGPIVQAVLDMETGSLGPFQEVSPDYGGYCSNDIEGPHLYHVGDWYYLFSAEGGTGRGHMQTVARSLSPWGPFEPSPRNPVLTHRHRVGHPIQSLGHADLVQAADGEWWAVALGTRHEARGGFVQHHNLGRETFLLPVRWVDGWPVIGTDGTTELEVELDRPLPGSAPSDERPRYADGSWSTTDPGGPPVWGDPATGDVSVPADGMALLPQTEDTQYFTARIAAGAPDGAGVAISSDAHHEYRLSVHGDHLEFVRIVDDLATHERVDVRPGAHLMRISCSPDSYEFFVDDDLAGRGSARLLSAEATEGFSSCHFALVGGIGRSTKFTNIERTLP